MVFRERRGNEEQQSGAAAWWLIASPEARHRSLPLISHTPPWCQGHHNTNKQAACFTLAQLLREEDSNELKMYIRDKNMF